ncbi:MAE_28990/MAE_18760 family HEPN-like nuclease [Pseudomonas guariconensis]|uniref:MAE_28990/MAE_18760 family HEPN-like nuclease n=1 Tax=Pseudomonas guariconensis TaxID=1288410 RepID=UPI00366DF76E
MATVFEVITEEFIDDAEAIQNIVALLEEAKGTAKARVAAANSATLLLAATFEEFVRQMAKEYAKYAVSKAGTVEKLPSKMISIAWKRTMDGLAKMKLAQESSGDARKNTFTEAQVKFSVIHDFCKGDLSQNIYDQLIHNENNMRPGEINSLFKVSGLGDICKKLSEKNEVLLFTGETERDKAHGKVQSFIEDFFERRNGIAHALNNGSSSSPERISTDLEFFNAFAKAMKATLDEVTAPPAKTPELEAETVNETVQLAN